MTEVSGLFDRDCDELDQLINVGISFDLKKRTLKIGSKTACLWYLGTLSNDILIEQILAFYLQVGDCHLKNADCFMESGVPAGDIQGEKNFQKTAKEILSGNSALLVEGLDRFIITDTKSIPSRSVGEPENDKVLRGSRDGFVESIIQNCAILRRRLCVQNLVLKKFTIGEISKSDVVMCYINGMADEKFVHTISEKLSSIQTDALTMGQESLAECLVHRKWWNPFPKFRYTERPDAVSAMLLEGSIILLCDNSPQAMILPCSIFDFIQESDDFYFPPLVGSYLRILRMIVFLIALFLTPIWYLLIKNPQWIPATFSFIYPEDAGAIPIIWQLLLVEFTIDGLKMASLNTPDALAGSLSIVAGLIIGDFAINIGWLAPDVILYMAFAAMANFTQPSFELGYAFKFIRILLLLLICFLNVAGFIFGLTLTLLFLLLNQTADGSRSYLYPLIPWNSKAILRQLFRTKKESQFDKRQDK